MKRNDLFTKLLAIGGTALIALPLLAGVLAAVLGYVTRGVPVFDYLLPLELFPGDLRDAWLVLLPLAALLTGEMAVTGVGGLLLVHDILPHSASPQASRKAACSLHRPQVYWRKYQLQPQTCRYADLCSRRPQRPARPARAHPSNARAQNAISSSRSPALG